MCRDGANLLKTLQSAPCPMPSPVATDGADARATRHVENATVPFPPASPRAAGPLVRSWGPVSFPLWFFAANPIFFRMPTSAALQHIPNLLTVARILMTPVVLLLLTVPTAWGQGGAVVLFVAASVSDYYDGVLARRMGARTRLGQFLDPLADKVLVLGTFAMLAVVEPASVPLWAVLAIAGRDLVVTAIRTWAESQGRTLRTFRIAKAKTMSQLAFLFGMLVLRTATHVPGLAPGARAVLDGPLPYGTLLLVVALTVGTGLLYVLQPQEEKMEE